MKRTPPPRDIYRTSRRGEKVYKSARWKTITRATSDGYNQRLYTPKAKGVYYCYSFVSAALDSFTTRREREREREEEREFICPPEFVPERPADFSEPPRAEHLARVREYIILLHSRFSVAAVRAIVSAQRFSAAARHRSSPPVLSDLS